jgi:hypothetical protein
MAVWFARVVGVEYSKGRLIEFDFARQIQTRYSPAFVF